MSQSKENEGLGTGLSKLPKIDKSSFMASYVKQQQRNTNVYEVEGKRYSQTWGKERKAKSSVAGSGISEAVERDALRKGREKEKGKGRARIDTPVLKPRNPELRTQAVATEKARSRPSGKENFAESKAREGRKGKEARTSKEVEWVKNAKVSKEAFESGGDTETRDREQRMNARKERRRERREIVNPKKRKGSPGRSSEDDSDGGKKKKGARSKKQKIPAGLALMHGFSATNVGKSRLTMEPTSRPTGVFSKGKASTKATTTRRMTAGAGFSEMAFLNQRRDRSPEPQASRSRHKEKAPTKQSKKASKVRAKEPTTENSESEGTVSGSSSSSDEEEIVQERPKRRPRSSSVTWDIERESAKLASSDLSAEVPLVKLLKPMESQEEVTPEGKKQSGHEGTKSSLGPHDSASQCLPRESSPPRQRPETNTFSKYFQQILDQDTSGQPSGKEVTHSIPCPTFVAKVPAKAKAPSPPPVDNKEPTVVSSHREGSGLSLWQMLHPNPPRDDDAPWSDCIPRDTMDYELWQEVPRPISGGDRGDLGFRGRYEVDSAQRADPASVEDVSIFKVGAMGNYEEPLEYWGDTGQLLGGQYSLDMDAGGDLFLGDMLDDYDEAGFMGDMDGSIPLSVYDNGVFEELYTGDIVGGLPEDYGHPGPDLIQWNPLELGGSQHEPTWQPMDEHDMEPDPLPQYDEHESMVALSELGTSGANNSTLQGLLSDSENVCQFLRGRSALLGFDADMGATILQPVTESGERRGASRAEIDVAKSLKNHWRPQRL